LNNEKTSSLYIHIPFCSSFCDYCDFYSVDKKNYADSYIDSFFAALIHDIDYQLVHFNIKNIPSVYIGGGTPSVLGGKIRILFNALKNIPCFSPLEFTIEANPESLTENFLDSCREGGVNRLSLGIQTFNEKSCKAVNRTGDVSLLDESLKLAEKYFPASFSVDLITGLPFQDEKTVLDDIKHTLCFNLSHVSLYSLILEKETVLYANVKNKEIILPDSETSDLLWLTGRDALVNEGFEHYEVSNFAKEGKICLHNMRYWRMQNWIGAGPSASGTIIDAEKEEARRFTYSCDIDEYIKNPFIDAAACEKLDKNLLLKERILMGFRLKECSDKAFKKNIPKTLARWEGKDKMLFLNSFLQDAFSELG
jgi:oxygen-independent coproporphyrinogen-3 oxidase